VRWSAARHEERPGAQRQFGKRQANGISYRMWLAPTGNPSSLPIRARHAPLRRQVDVAAPFLVVDAVWVDSVATVRTLVKNWLR
jgi:hypothetical protein